MRIAAMDGLRLVAGEFHPHFRRNALIRQRACEAVPQRMECARGQLAHARAFHFFHVQAGMLLTFGGVNHVLIC